MDIRRRLVSRVWDSGLSICAAAKEAGVSRQSAHLWIARAKEEGLDKMEERSRRPHHSPRSTSAEIVDSVMQIAKKYPEWGSSILYHVLWPADPPICERTMARILSRNGHKVLPNSEKAQEPIRFERSSPNELWQTDFKRVGQRRYRLSSMSLIDDASRYCLALQVVPNQTLEAAWDVLWSAFDEFGMPEAMLSDNGPAFKCKATPKWSLFDLRLMLLGIKPSHGRPYHPQTQGKVERLHLTLDREVNFRKENDTQTLLKHFRNRYNWLRPHHSLNKKTPGSVYVVSTRKRPLLMPEPFFPKDAVIRKCHDPGTFSFKGNKYNLGGAFIGLPVGILESETEGYNLVWGDFILGSLEELRV